MAKLLVHEKSADCLKSELDLFEPPPTQTSYQKSAYHEIPPSATLTESGPLEFYVSGSGDEYIDLMNTLLYLKVRIVTGYGSEISVASDKVGPVNLFMHSLFSQVEVTLNANANSLYPYRAMIETLTNYSAVAEDGELQTKMFSKDTAGKMEETDPA